MGTQKKTAVKSCSGLQETKRLSLALQGGGSHGAFTWGVLERLVMDRQIFIDGISGTSAGAMNTVVLAYNLSNGGRAAAIDSLKRFWQRVSEEAKFTCPMSVNPTPLMKINETIQYSLFDLTTRLFSPYQLNPLNTNPLRQILIEEVDFEDLRRRIELRLFICATNVRTSKVKVFTTPEMSIDVLLASSCLPQLFQAVNIKGEFYWDGGYLGNPVIYPLLHDCKSCDVMIVQIDPMYRDYIPTTSRDIMNRVNEISFNSSLIREMRGIATISKLIEAGHIHSNSTHYAKVNFHIITAEREISKLSAFSKLNADWGFLQELHALGYQAADKWLSQHKEDIGKKSTVNVFDEFL